MLPSSITCLALAAHRRAAPEVIIVVAMHGRNIPSTLTHINMDGAVVLVLHQTVLAASSTVRNP